MFTSATGLPFLPVRLSVQKVRITPPSTAARVEPTNLPTTGTATYTVKGINQYHAQNSTVLNGTLTADFSSNKLSGSLKNSGLTIAINNAAIKTAEASFSGNATANGTAGATHGHFFGNQGAVIAGVAEFGRNHAYNTAFGGTKTGK
ncbi:MULTISPECIES: Slam-dependent surface lipoprotein [Neisseria]|uniref:HphA C-terminal domain-containing protein n=1 Tax=Neisseria mucosa C102 TaxID=435832 RepID=A0ABN0CCU8_NEIMU|nr:MULTISPECIES: Slam-dependent surface lipoprotein [Neisseria]EFV81179.1 hypothetical protein HMPREF0604_00634 [Neisseria mucosa C102]